MMPMIAVSYEMNTTADKMTCVLKLKQYLHYDVVDGYVNQLDEIANETHNSKTYGGGYGNLLEFCKKNMCILNHMDA